MDRESHRAFQYHASVPYATETSEEALCELGAIVERIQKLYDTDMFQYYTFGSDYAYEAAIATRDLLAWQKRKLEIPLDIKLRLTKIYSTACFDAVEPSLMVRYGTACLSLWKGAHAKLELRKLRNVIDWKRLVRVVRNVVILGSVRDLGLGSRDTTSDSSGLMGGSSGFGHGALGSGAKCSSQVGVVLSLANTFRSSVESSEDLLATLRDNILSFLGPDGHDPSPYTVLESFTVLLPYNDPKASAVIVPMLFDLWDEVTPYVASLCILPAISEFVQSATLHSGGTSKFALTDEQLNICFQAVLQSFQIPLISTQRSKGLNKASQGRKVLGAGSRGDSDKLLQNNRSTMNTKPFGTHSGAFAKLVAWMITPDEARPLEHLKSLVNAVLSFCHPSNVGSWTALIFTTLMEVAEAYIYRVNMEEDMDVPQSNRLSEKISREFSVIMKSPILMGIHSQAPFIFATALDALRNLSLISPDTILPSLLAEAYPTLQHGLHEPHRLLTSLACLSRVTVPLTQQAKYAMHLTTLLELSLSSIDANEPKRCLLALAFFQAAASVCEFRDESDDESISVAAQGLPECVRSLVESGSQPTEIETTPGLASQILKGTSAAYPEILMQFMRRVFDLLETTTENRLGSAASASVLRVLLACSKSIFERLLSMTLTEILNPQQLSHDSFAQVCGSFVRADCALAFRPMWELLSRSIREEIIENQAGSGRTIMPKDNSLVRYLSILNMSLLAANSESLVEIEEDLTDLLRLLRKHTNANVVYTVANTLHHAVVGLVGHSVVLPNPQGKCPESGKLSVCVVPFCELKWNVPSERSRKFAFNLFKEHLAISENTLSKSLAGSGTRISDNDAVSGSLIFIRTALGATSVECGSCEAFDECRAALAAKIIEIYDKLSKDDVSGVKEVLFVAKVWMCDVGYERTAKLDSHQDTLYQFERRSFKIPGAHKNGIPPAVMARRAQLYHHQRLALKSQFRKADDMSIKLLLSVTVDSCFSAYPAVRRNAFSALYGPLKIFSDPKLYAEVCAAILNNIETLIDQGEFERASGGFSLLKYRSFAVQTLGQCPELLPRFMKAVCKAAAADHRHLSNSASGAFYSLVPDTFRIGTSLSKNDEFGLIRELYSELTMNQLEKLHWRDALFRATGLLALSQCPSFPLKIEAFRFFMKGSILHHPDSRTTAFLGALTLMQKAFKLGFVDKLNECYRTDGHEAVPIGAVQSSDNSLLENDWSQYFASVPMSVARAYKSQPRPSPKLLNLGSQGWLNLLRDQAQWRAPIMRDQQMPCISPLDEKELRSAMEEFNSKSYWLCLISLHKVEPRLEEDHMNRLAAFMFRNLVALGSYGFCDPNESLETLLMIDEIDNPKDLNDKNWHRVVADYCCGLMLALPIVTERHSALLLQKILQLVNCFLQSISPENIAYWSSALSFALSNVDYRRLNVVVELIESAAKPTTSNDGGGVKLSLRMEVYMVVIDVIGWRRPCLESVARGWTHYNHSLQTTRESCGDEISVAAASMHKIGEAETSILENLYDYEAPKVELSLLHLTLRLLQTLGGDQCLGLLRSKAFSQVLKSSAVRDDPETVVLVTQVFSELASCTFSSRHLESITKAVIERTRSAQWHQRIRMILFMQAFFFNHLLALSAENRLVLTMEIVNALTDSQAEVRELAADTLSGFVRCCPIPEQAHFVQELSSRFSTKVSRDTSLIDRHGAVLGLGALIGAFPYTSPPPVWIPKLLALLAVQAAGDTGIVGKSAKQVLGDFKKTRQDTWHIDQTVFTQNQLDDLEGVLWKNYFA